MINVTEMVAQAGAAAYDEILAEAKADMNILIKDTNLSSISYSAVDASTRNEDINAEYTYAPDYASLTIGKKKWVATGMNIAQDFTSKVNMELLNYVLAEMTKQFPKTRYSNSMRIIHVDTPLGVSDQSVSLNHTFKRQSTTYGSRTSHFR